jgi:integrase
MTRYLNWYRENQNGLVGSWFLVPSKKPDQWTWDKDTGMLGRIDVLADLRPENRVTHPYRAVQRALAVMGYETHKEGEHTLRRSGARALFDTLREQGYDGALMRVSSMLGHRDTRVTEHYIGLSLERTQRNAMFAGQPMFPQLEAGMGTLRVVRGEGHG